MLIATGATPRVLPTAVPDGERILDWRQVYDLPELPEHLIVVGSGVTGAEFASAYLAMGVDGDAGLQPRPGHAARGRRRRDGDRAGLPGPGHDDPQPRPARPSVARHRRRRAWSTLADGRTVEGSHALMAVGVVPNTAGARACASTASRSADGGYVTVDRVSRTNVPGIYAAGDCTGVLPLASVAAMQGRIAIWHALGEAVAPLRLRTVVRERLHRPRAGHRRRHPERRGRRQGAGPRR